MTTKNNGMFRNELVTKFVKVMSAMLVVCMLVFSMTACGTVSQQDVRPTTEHSTEEVGNNDQNEPVDPIDDGYWHDDPTEEPTTEEPTEEPTSQPQTGAYTYNVYGYTISMDVNVDDYISSGDSGKVFKLARMAYDLGWAGNDIYTAVDSSDYRSYSSEWYAHHDGDITTRIDLGYYNEEQVPGRDGSQFRTLSIIYPNSGVNEVSTACTFAKHYDDCEYMISGTGWYASYEDIVMITYIFWSAANNPGVSPMISTFGTDSSFVSSYTSTTIEYSLP